MDHLTVVLASCTHSTSPLTLMPLPENEAVAFRGLSSTDGQKRFAISGTFSQKLIDLIFARRESLRAAGSEELNPFDIDFDNKVSRIRSKPLLFCSKNSLILSANYYRRQRTPFHTHTRRW